MSSSGFHNIKPRTRDERRALTDKESWEKDRLSQRKECFVRVDATIAGRSMTQYVEGSQGFMSNADRFHTDVAGEEKNFRDDRINKQRMIESKRRVENQQKDETRWSDLERKFQNEQQRIVRHQEEGLKAFRNQSSVPFNPITLEYNDTSDGKLLRDKDEAVKVRANMRAKNLHDQLNRNGVNPITGEDLPPVRPVFQTHN